MNLRTIQNDNEYFGHVTSIGRAMNVDFLIPLLGVLVGWLLNELSSAFRIRKEDKRTLRRSIATLLYLRSQMATMISVLQSVKQFSASPNEHERSRQYILELYTLSENFEKQIEGALEEIAVVDPLLANDLRSTKDLYSFVLTTRFNFVFEAPTAEREREAIESFYNEMIESLSIDKRYLRRFEKRILRLCMMHGLTLWIRVKREFALQEEREEEFWRLMSLHNCVDN
jgi:hypothetical protein